MHLEAFTISCAKTERCLFFLASALPLSCLIFDQRLCPDNTGGEEVKDRQQRIPWDLGKCLSVQQACEKGLAMN